MFLSDGSRVSIAPQALAELNPIIPQGYYYADHTGIELEYRHALYGQIYEQNPWVHTVIEKRAEAVAALPVNVWDVNQAGTRVLDTTSQYARLLANPCPFMDNFRFWAWVQSTIDIYGETYLAMCRSDAGFPIGFFPMHPSRVALKRDPKTGNYTYYFQAGSGIGTELLSFEEKDVVPFRLFHPEKLERGMSRMEAIRQTIFADESSRNAVAAMWKNSGRPNLVLEAPKQVSEPGAKRLREAFAQIHSGSANTGKALILEEGITAKPFQLSAVELELVGSRKMNREEICAVYNIAPTLVGILDHATFSNVAEQMRAFYRDTMRPVIEFIQSVVDNYVGSQWGRKNIMRFAVDEVIRGDYEMRAQSAQHLITCGVMTPNEGRELIGLNRMDDADADKLTNLADRLYANSAMQPLGAPAEQIRIMGQLTGPTPDGIGGPPAVTPVASLDGSRPNSVPGLPAGRSAAGGSQGPSNANPSTTPVPKHLRAIKGLVGRGRSDDELWAFAFKLYDEHPDDLDDLLRAVSMAIAERDYKRGK